MKPILRYWDCRGRAQPLRDLLADRCIDFVDEQVPGAPDPAAWLEMKADSSKSGPFGALPILHWEGQLVAETSVIGDFLIRRLELHRGLSEQAALRSMTVRSAANEYGGWAGGMIHCSTLYPGCDAKTVAQRHVHWILEGLRRLDAQLPADGGFLGGAQPDLADFTLLESAEGLSHICEDAGRSFVATLPRLAPLVHCLRERPRIQTLWAGTGRPDRLTGNLDEAEVLAELRSVDWAVVLPARDRGAARRPDRDRRRGRQADPPA